MIRTVLALALCFAAGAAAAQDLVVDHEKIADEKLWAAAKQEREFVLYGTIPTESMSIALDQFTKDTGVAYEYIRLPTAKMYDRVLAEFGANKLDADYVGLTDLSLVKAWAERGILAKYKVTAFADLSDDIRDPQGAWYYVVRPISTLAVNTEMVSDAETPKSWKDILDPKWKGKIGMPSMDAGGSALTLYSFLRLKVAPDYWTRLAANEPRIYATAAPVVNDLVRGRTAVSMSGASSYLQQIEAKAPVKIIFPTQGLAAFGEIGNVTSSARHPNAARLYMSWITSKRGAGWCPSRAPTAPIRLPRRPTSRATLSRRPSRSGTSARAIGSATRRRGPRNGRRFSSASSARTRHLRTARKPANTLRKTTS